MARTLEASRSPYLTKHTQDTHIRAGGLARGPAAVVRRGRPAGETVTVKHGLDTAAASCSTGWGPNMCPGARGPQGPRSHMTRASARQGPAPQPPRPSVQMEEGAFLQLRPLWGLRWSSVTRQESYGKGVPAQGKAGSRGRRRLQILGSCIWVTGQRAEPGP